MAFCANCGAQLADDTTFCGRCGKPVAPVAANPPMPGVPDQQPAGMPAPPVIAPAATAGLADNVAGMLAYVTIIPAIVFLLVEPYNKKPFVRFHSFQSIFFGVAWMIIWIVLSSLLFTILGMFAHLLMSLLWLGFIVLWVVVLIQAYQGKMFKLPVIGDLAQKQANNI